MRTAQALLAASYLVLVLANVACSVLGVYSCSLLLMLRHRPSVRWARRGFLWNLVAVGTISYGTSFGVPLQQVSLFLLLFLCTQLITVVGFRGDLRRRLDPIITAFPAPSVEEKPEPDAEKGPPPP